MKFSTGQLLRHCPEYRKAIITGTPRDIAKAKKAIPTVEARLTEFKKGIKIGDKIHWDNGNKIENCFDGDKANAHHATDTTIYR